MLIALDAVPESIHPNSRFRPSPVDGHPHDGRPVTGQRGDHLPEPRK
jgi:hypothetical protein